MIVHATRTIVAVFERRHNAIPRHSRQANRLLAGFGACSGANLRSTRRPGRARGYNRCQRRRRTGKIAPPSRPRDLPTTSSHIAASPRSARIQHSRSGMAWLLAILASIAGWIVLIKLSPARLNTLWTRRERLFVASLAFFVTLGPSRHHILDP